LNQKIKKINKVDLSLTIEPYSEKMLAEKSP
jgi:hypothetical protein